MPSRRDLTLMLLVTALFAGLTGGVLLGGLGADVLLVAPVLVLAIPLVAGRYVGEAAIGRLAAAYAARRRRAPAALDAPVRGRAARTLALRDRLVAGAHVCRPPPALLTVP